MARTSRVILSEVPQHVTSGNEACRGDDLDIQTAIAVGSEEVRL